MQSTSSPNAKAAMAALVNTDRYPVDDPERATALIDRCRRASRQSGSFSLDGFLRPAALSACVAEIEPLMAAHSYHHEADHNVYFASGPEVPPRFNLPAFRQRSSNHTLTADQLEGSIIRKVYEWPSLAQFLMAVLDKPSLHPMADPMACLNVMGYGDGEQIGWHFDRSEFTVTLLLQRPETGGVFRYRHNLRDVDDPNHAGVARLLSGRDDAVRDLPIEPGTLNVFAGYRSPHHVTPSCGARRRLVAVLSFMDRPGVMFSAEDRVRFYGRAAVGDPVPERM